MKKDTVDALKSMAKNVRWYRDGELDGIADLVEEERWEEAYEEALVSARLTGFTAVDDTGYYILDFYRELSELLDRPHGIRNCTPHPVDIVTAEGKLITSIPPSGTVARLEATTVAAGCVMDIPLTRTTFAPATGLPEKKEGILIIVSQMVKNALPDRDDLVVPTEMVRDAEGKILGCRSLGR